MHTASTLSSLATLRLVRRRWARATRQERGPGTEAADRVLVLLALALSLAVFGGASVASAAVRPDSCRSAGTLGTGRLLPTATTLPDGRVRVAWRARDRATARLTSGHRVLARHTLEQRAGRRHVRRPAARRPNARRFPVALSIAGVTRHLVVTRG